VDHAAARVLHDEEGEDRAEPRVEELQEVWLSEEK
jgi:hypothetical protein